jgi:hypothetical protein
MSLARTRALSFIGVLAIVAAAAFAVILSTSHDTARAADALQPSVTRFSDDRFTSTSALPIAYSGTVPEQMVALRGETEGFQFVMQNNAGAALDLNARVVGDGGAFAVGGVLSPSFLRVAMVNVPTASSKYGTSPGLYADPLPPIAAGASNGLLHIEPAQLGGILFQVRVSTAATPATYSGNLELFDPRTDTVFARQGFTLQVANGGGRAIMQPGEKGAMKTTFGVEGLQYWNGPCAMRNGPGGPCGQQAQPQRGEQLAGLMSFLDEHHFTPLETSLAVPHANGSYSGCRYDFKGVSVDFLTQLKTRYFGNGQHPVRWMPFRTEGCADQRSDTMYATVESGAHGVKQDDVLDKRAPGFWKTVAKEWSGNGLFTSATYVKNPFDEPGDATAKQRKTMQIEVPKANIALHRAVGKKAKIVLAGWPRDERMGRKCGKLKKTQKKAQCFKYEHDLYGNRKMWDGKGADDVDIWMVPISRLWGRITQPHLKKLKVNRDREYSDRLAAIRKKHRSETWHYSFYTADKRTPQTVIDAQGSDQVLLYWLAAREGVTGIYFSNLLMGWGNEPKNNPAGTLKNGDPYSGATYFQHPIYGQAAGWGTYIYPPYAAQFGLTSEDQRNSANGRPVSSLRFEGMRDGQEDANLMFMYAKAKGQKALNKKMLAIAGKTFRPQIRSLGQVVAPVYSNKDMSQRLETLRRQMIAELG